MITVGKDLIQEVKPDRQEIEVGQVYRDTRYPYMSWRIVELKTIESLGGDNWIPIILLRTSRLQDTGFAIRTIVYPVISFMALIKIGRFRFESER